MPEPLVRPWTRRRAATIAALVLAPVVTGPLDAQSTVPDDIKRRLIEIGFAPPYASSDSIYLPLLARVPRSGVTVTKDLAYGSDRRHRLDVYRPDGAARAPVFVYVHGGGYRTGDRDINEEIYANVLNYFSRHGMLGINATYRLAPDATWPSGGEDMRQLIDWVRANAAEYGGDPDRIFMMGHSAGATHVATYAFDRRFQPASGHGLAGVVLVSGRYTIKDEPADPTFDGIRLYFGDDPSGYPTRSVVTHVPGSDVAAMLVIAEYDQRNLVETTGELFVALCDRDEGRCPRFLQLKYHNHMSEISHINTQDDLLGSEILEFFKEGAARQTKNAAEALIVEGADRPGGTR
ncbi:MAG: alpha/beta hydrolase fold domain-containing protein [Gemmatimonadota bacterium]|nr:alpha/beta hydrolase fold domain-containing protein [Gemmatimonadota bacterium]